MRSKAGYVRPGGICYSSKRRADKYKATNTICSDARWKVIIYAPREKIKNASDRMFVTLAFGSGGNLQLGLKKYSINSE